MTIYQLKDKSGNVFEPSTPTKCGFPYGVGTPLGLGDIKTADEDGYVAVSGASTVLQPMSIEYSYDEGATWQYAYYMIGDSPISTSILVPMKKGMTYRVIGGVGVTAFFIKNAT